MKKGYATGITGLLIGSLYLGGVAAAHGMHGHEPADTQMRKLHAMMPMFADAVAGMEAALAKGDAVTLENQARRVLHEIPELKRSKPHKHAGQQKRFAEHADRLKTAVTATAELAKKGDLTAARAAFVKIGESCTACHSVFRD